MAVKTGMYRSPSRPFMNSMRLACALLCLPWAGHAAGPAPVRVACVGDSITQGVGTAHPEKESYPAQLQALLGGGSPGLGRYQSWSPMTDADALAFLVQMSEAPLFAPGAWVQLGIAEPVSDRLIGDIGVFLSADGLTGEVGFTLEPGSQGRGIATAAVCAALDLFFTSTQARQVRGITDSRNLASVRLLERAGFKHLETRQAVFKGEACVEEVFEKRRPETLDLPSGMERCS